MYLHINNFIHSHTCSKIKWKQIELELYLGNVRLKLVQGLNFFLSSFAQRPQLLGLRIVLYFNLECLYVLCGNISIVIENLATTNRLFPNKVGLKAMIYLCDRLGKFYMHPLQVRLLLQIKIHLFP